MATVFSPSAILSSSATAVAKPQSVNKQPPLTLSVTTGKQQLTTAIATAITAALATTTILSCPSSMAAEPYQIYYGTAASAANYGGYGGNSDKKTSAEYIYAVPEGWKERLVSKIEKGTNGTDSEFYNPKKKSEKEYLTFLAGQRQLGPRETVLNNLALSDVVLQDLIAGADELKSEEKKDENGQVYYVYEIDGIGKHSLISVTCANNKLFAHFVNAPSTEWSRDQEMLRSVHDSFKTVN